MLSVGGVSYYDNKHIWHANGVPLACYVTQIKYVTHYALC